MIWRYPHFRNGCIDFFVFFRFFCFSVWGTFPCYLLHFGAKTCTLLNFGTKMCHFALSIEYSMVFAGFSMVFMDLPKFFIDFPYFSVSFPWVQLIFPWFRSIFPWITCTGEHVEYRLRHNRVGSK